MCKRKRKMGEEGWGRGEGERRKAKELIYNSLTQGKNAYKHKLRERKREREIKVHKGLYIIDWMGLLWVVDCG